MSQSLSCPVCGRQGLPADCAVCPQCDSDLTCFQVLDSLSLSKAAPDAPPAQKKARRIPWLAVLSGAGLVLLLAALSAGWQNKVPKLYHKLTAAAEPAGQEQIRQAVLPEAGSGPSDGKIHIDAQIRILDDRQKQQAACQSSPPAVPAATPESDKPAQPEVQQPPAPPTKSPQTVSAVDAAAAPEAVIEPEQSNKDKNGPESQPVELAEPAAKEAGADQQPAQAAAAPPTELPVLRGRRKRAVRTRTVSSLRQATAKSTKKKSSKSTFVYHAQNGETVWELAERFYGEGKYYPLIMELNPHILQGSVRGSGKVRLLADRRQAAALYQRSTEQRDGMLLWKHKVQPGETWQSLYARFFPPKYSGMVFYPGDQNVVPGSTVRIILR